MLFRSIVDMREPGALITRLRRRRVRQFLGLLERVPRPLHILDVGGTQFFWDILGITPDASLQITLLNTVPYPCDRPHFTQLVGVSRGINAIGYSAYKFKGFDWAIDSCRTHVANAKLFDKPLG